ncbi:MAG: hypothetical protein R3Y24_03810 [Eubacteriales bacterium]
MKKTLALVLSMLLVVGTLSGCSAGTATTSESTVTEVETEQVSSTNEEETIYLEYWIAGDPSRTPVYEASIEAFMVEILI